MLLPHMVVKGKVGSIPVQFYCLSLHIKSIEIACGISDVWAGSMYWLSSKWSEQIWYELYNCFAVFEPRSPGLVCMTHLLDLLTLYHLIRRHPDLPAAVQSGVTRCPAVPFNPAQSGIDNMCCVIGDIPVIAAENVIKTRGKHQTRSQGLVVECVM